MVYMVFNDQSDPVRGHRQNELFTNYYWIISDDYRLELLTVEKMRTSIIDNSGI